MINAIESFSLVHKTCIVYTFMLTATDLCGHKLKSLYVF